MFWLAIFPIAYVAKKAYHAATEDASESTSSYASENSTSYDNDYEDDYIDEIRKKKKKSIKKFKKAEKKRLESKYGITIDFHKKECMIIEEDTVLQDKIQQKEKYTNNLRKVIKELEGMKNEINL